MRVGPLEEDEAAGAVEDGFRVAVAADVPILVGVFDFGRKELRLEATFHPSGDYDADLPKLRAYYRPEQAKYPEKYVA